MDLGKNAKKEKSPILKKNFPYRNFPLGKKGIFWKLGISLGKNVNFVKNRILKKNFIYGDFWG